MAVISLDSGQGDTHFSTLCTSMTRLSDQQNSPGDTPPTTSHELEQPARYTRQTTQFMESPTPATYSTIVTATKTRRRQPNWVKKCGPNLELRPPTPNGSRNFHHNPRIQETDDLCFDPESPCSDGEHGERSLDELAEENEEMRDEMSCKVCYDKFIDIVFLPCGHLACCEVCGQQLTDCPLCRKYIIGTVRITRI